MPDVVTLPSSAPSAPRPRHPPLWRAIGLMSGTSLDGIDAALIETDGLAQIEGARIEGARIEGARIERRAALTVPYPAELRQAVRHVLGERQVAPEIEQALTLAHAQAVAALLTQAGLEAGAIDVVGFHGHTVLHRPSERITVQIGDGALLARRIGIDVVNDLRAADVAAGGQGAPLVPVFHRALSAELPNPLAVVNIGGVANVTWIGVGSEGDIESRPLLAFDTGPGNAPIDDWALAWTGTPVDQGGKLAEKGRVEWSLLRRLLTHPYFDRKPPKSLDRNDFTAAMATGLSGPDGAATLTRLTAGAIARGAEHFPAAPRLWVITGGGRHNPVLMAALARELRGTIATAEQVGWDGDALEAQAFAYLAVRSRLGLALSLPSTTGVPAPMPGGRFHPGGQS